MPPGPIPHSVPRLVPFTVGDWVVEPRTCRLSRGETVVKLRPQLVDLLACLARRAGDIALKDEILSEVWPGQFIAESGLSRCIAELRQALQDDADKPRFIETFPKRGYRLIAPVAWLEEERPPGAEPQVVGPHRSHPETADAGSQPPAGAAPRIGRATRLWTTAALAVLAAGAVSLILLERRTPARMLSERDTVLLADVNNSTRERVFDDALRLALAVNLEQAPFLRILPQEAVRAALVRAGRSPDERVVGPLALEICRREAAAVLLAGSIASLGSRYAVGIEAIVCGTGESLGHELAEAASREGVLAALEQAASRIRRRLGESRESLRQHDVPLVRATTPSLEALRALTLGDARRDKGFQAEALSHYRHATEIDPQFALAWARRGLTARNIDRRDEAIPALSRAFELRDRASEPERFFIEGLYQRFVAGEPEKAIEIFKAWRRMYPGSAVPANYIAATLSDEMGQYEAAVAEAREAVRLAPSTNWPYNNLAQACLGAGRYTEMKTVIADAARRGLDDWSMHAYLLIVALMEGDQAAVEREMRWGAGDARTEAIWLMVRANAAANGGQLGEARRLSALALAKARQTGAATDVAEVHLNGAEIEALLGDRKAARAMALAALDADRRPVFVVRSAIVLAILGELPRARALLGETASLVATDAAPLKVWLPVLEAVITAREGRAEDALRILQPVAAHEKGNDYLLVPVGIRGLVCALAGRPAEAAAAFQDLLRVAPVIGPTAWEAFARLGLARAFRDAGDTTRSLAAYDALLESWKTADPGMRLLGTVRRERAAAALH